MTAKKPTHIADGPTSGAIFTAVAATLHPFYGSAAAYSATGNFAEGLTEPEFLASICKIFPCPEILVTAV